MSKALHASLHVRPAKKRRCMAKVATLLSRDMSEVFRRKSGGRDRRPLGCPADVEVRWNTSGSACVLAPSVFGRLLRD